MEATMAQTPTRTTEGRERSGYIRGVANPAKVGVDKASDYLEGVTEQTAEYVKGAVNETQEQVAEFGSRRIDDVWTDAIRCTKGRSTMWKWMIAMAGIVTVVATLSGCATAPTSAAGRADLDRDVSAALARAGSEDPTLQAFLDKAYGYAIFPGVGKGAVGVGGAYGKGEVFERGKKIGYCDLSQATIGLQLGGQTYTEIIAFENKAALDNFKNGSLKFAGEATAVALKAGAGANAEYVEGVRVLTVGEQGLMFEAAIGGQTFTFQPM
jgi:lipid-binding SYLF domain-containing protein